MDYYTSNGFNKEYKLEKQIELMPKIKQPYILQTIGKTPTRYLSYRRHLLRNWLNDNFNYPVYSYTYGPFFQDYSLIKYFIVSHPDDFNFFYDKLPKGCKIFYDKTDYWQWDDKNRDKKIIEAADKITCSSKYIYNSLPKEKTLLVENGLNYFKPDDSIKKFDKKTAIYVGYPLDKFNVMLLKKIAIENPDMNFLVFVESMDKKNKLNIQDYNLKACGNIFLKEPIEDKQEVFNWIQKCHVGLILLKNDSDWNKGMFSLKFWDYLSCHIPVYHNCELNYDSYEGKYCFSTKKYTIKDVLNKKMDLAELDKTLKENDWNNKFKQIIDFYGIK